VSEATPVAPAAEPGFFEKLTSLYVSPTEAFRAIVARPKVLVPLVILVVLVAGFTALWVSKVDPVAFMREQIEQNPRTAEMPAEQKAAIVEQQAKFMPYFAVLPVFFVPLFYLATAGIYLVIFRFMYGADLTYKQSLAIVVWSFLAVGLVSTPLLVLVLFLKGDWNLDPNTVLQANVSLLVPATAPKWLVSLASSLDIFSFWTMALLAAGYGVASRRTLGGALAGVMAPWLVYVILKVGWAAMMG
jgi:hypothetical protein